MPGLSVAGSVELAPGVHALSNLVDLARPVSWVAAGTPGFDPSNCYLLLDHGEALLVDTGLRAHGDNLVAQMNEIIAPDTPLHLALTRVEPDCLGNLIDIAEQFRLVRLSSQTNVVPFDYLGPFSARFPDVEINNGLHPGDVVAFGRDRHLVVVEPAVRTLPTMWYFDQASGSLFTSDFFGEDRLARADDWAPHEVDVRTARGHLLTKFDWLGIADTSAAVARLDGIFQRLQIELLAPGHGLWTLGAAAVRDRYQVVRDALRFGREVTS